MAEINHTVDHESPEQEMGSIVPGGDYIAVIESSDYVEAKSGNGMNLQFFYQILDGPFKGNKIFENLCLQHIKPSTQEIAKRQLNSIGMAVGLPNGAEIKDSAILHDIPMLIRVTVEKNTDPNSKYEKQNNITKHLPIKGVKPPVNKGTNSVENFPDQADSPAEPQKEQQPWDK